MDKLSKFVQLASPSNPVSGMARDASIRAQGAVAPFSPFRIKRLASLSRPLRVYIREEYACTSTPCPSVLSPHKLEHTAHCNLLDILYRKSLLSYSYVTVH